MRSSSFLTASKEDPTVLLSRCLRCRAHRIRRRLLGGLIQEALQLLALDLEHLRNLLDCVMMMLLIFGQAMLTTCLVVAVMHGLHLLERRDLLVFFLL